MSDSEGEQQHAEKDKASQLVIELTKQILHTMEAQKKRCRLAQPSNLHPRVSHYPISCILKLSPTLNTYSECECFVGVQLKYVYITQSICTMESHTGGGSQLLRK